MAKICQAGITKTYKRKRADCTWPGYASWRDDLPRCGGEVTFTVEVEGGGPCYCGDYYGGDYCYCTGPELQVTAKCSRCSGPYVEGMTRELASSYDACKLFERYLNG